MFLANYIFHFVLFPCVFTATIAQHNTHSVHLGRVASSLRRWRSLSVLVHASDDSHSMLPPSSVSFAHTTTHQHISRFSVTFQRRRRRHIVRFVPFCFFVSWSRIFVGLRGFRPCGGECLDPKHGEQCLTRTHFRAARSDTDVQKRSMAPLTFSVKLLPWDVQFRLGSVVLRGLWCKPHDIFLMDFRLPVWYEWSISRGE